MPSIGSDVPFDRLAVPISFRDTRCIFGVRLHPWGAVGLSVAEQGWSVAICYRLSEKEARETIVSAINRGVRGSVEQCDASDHPKAVADFAESVEKQWGSIDPLINCAGTIVSTRSRNGRRLVGDVCHQSSSGILSEPGVRYSPSRKAASAGLGTGKMASLHATKDLKTF